MVGLTPLYNPIQKRHMNCVVFSSGSGTNLKELTKKQIDARYQIRAVFVDRQCGAMDVAEKMGIPLMYQNGDNYCGTWEAAESSGPIAVGKYFSLCDKFDAKIANDMEGFVKNRSFGIDMVLLAGYKRNFGTNLVNAFKDKIIEVQPSKLAVRGDDGKRLYKGENAVLKAIANGEKQTYSTIHLVGEEPFEGECLVRSRSIGVDFAFATHAEDIVNNFLVPKVYHALEGNKTSDTLDDFLADFEEKFPDELKKVQDVAIRHQDRQKGLCDWPAFTYAATLIAEGRVKLSDELDEFGLRKVHVDNKEVPFGGYELR